MTLCRHLLIGGLAVRIEDRPLLHTHHWCVHAIHLPGAHVSALSISTELHLHLVLLLLHVELLLLM